MTNGNGATRMNGISMITFDADDTLWDFSSMIQRGLRAVSAEIMARLGDDFAFMTPEHVQTFVAAEFARQDPQTIDYLDARRTAFAACLTEANCSDVERFAGELMEIYVAARSPFIFFDDTYHTLDALYGKIPLGWITNGTTRPEMAGLEGYFDVVITRDTLNMRKPRPEVFHYAAELANCHPESIMHIGDSLYADVQGALEAGCHAVWYNPRQEANDSGIQPSAEIHTLTAILDLL